MCRKEHGGTELMEASIAAVDAAPLRHFRHLFAKQRLGYEVCRRKNS